MRDQLNSLDFKTRLIHKGKLARDFVILLKINALVLLLSALQQATPRSRTKKPERQYLRRQ
jgi:hypothetical protein